MDTRLLAILVVLGFVLLYSVSLWKARKRVLERMALAQRRLELSDVGVVKDSMTTTLTGLRGSTRVRLVGHLLGSTDVHASIEAPLPPGLRLSPQERKSAAPGTQDIQIGLPVLDDRLQVRSANPSAAIRYLRDERTRRALRGLMEGAPGAEVNEGEVRLPVSALEDLSQFERKAQAVIQAAGLLAEAALPEGTRRPEAPPPAAPEDPSQTPMAQVSSEYLVRMRFEYSQRRLRLWYAHGALLATGVFMVLGYEGSLEGLSPFAPYAREWNVMLVIVGLVYSGFILLIDRCPACSVRLAWRQRPAHTSLFGGKRVECPQCGIQLR